MSVSTDRLRDLDNIEKELQAVLQCAGAAIQELSKDKPTIKQVEQQSNSFLKSLQSVEANTSKQIQYLTQSSTGQAHEGSCYASQKVLNMAWHRLEHARLRLNDLERCRMQYMQQTNLLNMCERQQQQPPPPPQLQPQQQQPPSQQQQTHLQAQQQPQPPPAPLHPQINASPMNTQ